ncbi:hypothetical protein ACWCQW_44880 [Streptomyces mirabilis]
MAEDVAFWEWATVELLRHSGIRAEELTEPTHLSIRPYQRPNGEVVALLVVAPSKSDRERVIPMSAEFFHAVAQIVRRQTPDGKPIPLVSRYDLHEKTCQNPCRSCSSAKSARSVVSWLPAPSWECSAAPARRSPRRTTPSPA